MQKAPLDLGLKALVETRCVNSIMYSMEKQKSTDFIVGWSVFGEKGTSPVGDTTEETNKHFEIIWGDLVGAIECIRLTRILQ